ncbi:peptidoglycan DD-metalloendopeptidase family protein [Phyllobacterium sp. YR531]|uniref:peptidoglycan DD-metalloendopeptidase family protein n=1 Tax=Phyllobacterium sp. YR531 TaxID=1144343 RepID=UPI00026FBBB5|nr:peptidoglycan DD-metalloendopeptidase family protein [Phyllobacterium sp. YR531]EJM97815.1 metalloendopeptidase-like membrane protein [Phyllobacterium sp. YR531]
MKQEGSLHTINPDFKQAKKLSGRRRAIRRLARIVSIAFAIAAVGSAVHFIPRFLGESEDLTDQALVIPEGEVIASDKEGDFELAATDDRRDALLLQTVNNEKPRPRKSEIRFQKNDSGSEIKGPIFYVSDTMLSASVRLMTALPATPQDFALMQSAQEAPPTSATPVSQPEEGSMQGDTAPTDAGWEGAVSPRETEQIGQTSPGSSNNIEIIDEKQRPPQNQQYVIKVLAERSVTDVLTDGHTTPAENAHVSEAVARLLNIQLLRPGYLAVWRTSVVDPQNLTTAPVQLSLYGTEGLIGSVARADDGTYLRIDDPWKDESWTELVTGGKSETSEQNFRIMDGIYSAGIRNDIPANVVTETITRMSRLYDLGKFISPQDKVTLLYSETPRDELSESGRVLYVSIKRSGETLQCYLLRPERGGDYSCMTESDTTSGLGGAEGFVLPVKGVFRSGFGPRVHPILGSVKFHEGVDWSAPAGTPVYASFDGTVSFAGTNGNFGNFIKITHAGNRETHYAHLQGFAGNIAVGKAVKAGQIIGFVGSTGLSTGPHLHFELIANGSLVDPLGSSYSEVALDGEAAKLVQRIIHVESGGNPNAANPLSSASGLGQFINSTWLRMMNSYRGDLVSKMSVSELLALKFDPTLATEMVMNLANENEATLKASGIPGTAGNLYLAHFLGGGGAVTVLSAAPDTQLSSLFDQSVFTANPFLYGKTAGWIVDWSSRKMSGSAGGMVSPVYREARIKASRFRQYSSAIDDILSKVPG